MLPALCWNLSSKNPDCSERNCVCVCVCGTCVTTKKFQNLLLLQVHHQLGVLLNILSLNQRLIETQSATSPPASRVGAHSFQWVAQAAHRPTKNPQLLNVFWVPSASCSPSSTHSRATSHRAFVASVLRQGASAKQNELSDTVARTTLWFHTGNRVFSGDCLAFRFFLNDKNTGL